MVISLPNGCARLFCPSTAACSPFRCAGSGKTELCKQFQEAGFWVLDEAFLDMPKYALHPQSLLMETGWVVNWFLRLLRKAAEVKDVDGPEPVRPHFVIYLV